MIAVVKLMIITTLPTSSRWSVFLSGGRTRRTLTFFRVSISFNMVILNTQTSVIVIDMTH